MYYKGPEKKCLDILERLDNYLGYPNNDSKTLTTSSVGFVSNVISEVGGKYHQRGMDKYNAANDPKGPKPTFTFLQRQKELKALRPKVQTAIDSNNFNSINTKARSVEIDGGDYVLSRDGIDTKIIPIRQKGARQAIMNWFMDSTEFIYEDPRNPKGKGPLMSLQNPEKGSVDYYFNLITE